MDLLFAKVKKLFSLSIKVSNKLIYLLFSLPLSSCTLDSLRGPIFFFFSRTLTWSYAILVYPPEKITNKIIIIIIVIRYNVKKK